MADEQNNYIDQATSIAIQDAVDNIRNVTDICNTASGVAMAKLLEGGDKVTCLTTIAESNQLIANAISNYEKIVALSIECRKKNTETASETTRKRRFFLF
ncbi:hypothetical protein GCM10007938_24880 [Vibrio zhanjiangensis]|uniref:Methyl-accepting transducer domain-containing protein n=1 Tax=Vibrio zhanjiangensis TaxID=1046128 RepID=A0ABQ6F0C0_9VIBR|nr:hypothetical protein [Vibrio zhanjiangensis]GLT18707.1 hypothetical protein GCM10007938_24880 [Vibrio zhanjiangensis]